MPSFGSEVVELFRGNRNFSIVSVSNRCQILASQLAHSQGPSRAPKCSGAVKEIRDRNV